MSKIFTIFLFSCFLFSCDIRKNETKTDVLAEDRNQVLKDSTSVEMIDSVFNFGKITDGEKVEFSFRFKNSGTKPLIITNASASCGCTVPEKPEAPIKPGETGFIKVAFNSQGRVGNAHKEVNVTSNANPAFPVLLVQGEVLAAKK
jgi:hypothetical protein